MNGSDAKPRIANQLLPIVFPRLPRWHSRQFGQHAHEKGCGVSHEPIEFDFVIPHRLNRTENIFSGSLVFAKRADHQLLKGCFHTHFLIF